ncbi:MAG TPA: hypothetical protein VFZ09_46930 [Archangium sp.]|uniref:hypothetical protein n=1 Tax=Archangium sp. TaxID=1872627 RepID=UPI002E36A00D|nr:hypothetical protein [Archangium sp.]HEX5753810.1 hypothetical protein [Archangium sp.]
MPPGVGETLPLGHVRRLLLDVNNPLVEQLRAVELEYRARGTTLFSMCDVERHYTPRELRAAEYVMVGFWPFFRPTGVECGTVYDDSTACARCGSGARQVNELHLELRRIPKSRDLAITQGGEYVISSRLVEVLRQHRITGYELRPIVSRGGRPTSDHHQLVIPSATAEVVPPTQAGGSCLYPEPDSSRCPDGHVLGHQLLSSLHVSSDSLGDLDWVFTRQKFGRRGNLYHPYSMMIVTQRLYRLLAEQKVRHLHAEVVHLV